MHQNSRQLSGRFFCEKPFSYRLKRYAVVVTYKAAATRY